MRDGDGGAPAGELRQRRLDGVLALVVKGARGLVQNEDARVAQKHARDGDALLLAAGQPRAALAHERVVAVGQRADELVDVGLARRLLDFGLGGAGAAVGDVLPHRAAEQIHVLLHDADGVAQACQ